MKTMHRWLTIPCFTFTALFLLLSCLGGSAAAKDCPSAPVVLNYDPEVSRLEGTLSQREVYGPPGYGEDPAHDKKGKITVLKLFCPIEVKPAANAGTANTANLDPFKNVSEIQLFYSGVEQQAFSRQHLGKRIFVVGSLEQATVGGEYTKVVMDVKRMGALEGERTHPKKSANSRQAGPEQIVRTDVHNEFSARSRWVSILAMQPVLACPGLPWEASLRSRRSDFGNFGNAGHRLFNPAKPVAELTSDSCYVTLCSGFLLLPFNFGNYGDFGNFGNPGDSIHG